MFGIKGTSVCTLHHSTARREESQLESNMHHRRLRLVNALLQADILNQQNAINVRRRRRQRRWWVRPWILRRPAYGHFEHLMVELRIEDPASFQNFVRFEPDMFQELVDRVSPIIAKQDTNFRKALEPGLKIAITLRYLATGETSKSLGYGFRVAYNSICLFLPEVCRVIVQVLADEVMKTPTTPDEW